jgi:hypothetical protein
MSTLLNVTLIIVIGGAFMSWLLRMADIALDREKKEEFKARIERFWFQTAKIEFPGKLRRALKARYALMSDLRRSFLGVFVLICGGLAIAGAVRTIYVGYNANDLVKGVNFNFEQRYNFHCHILLGD